MKIDTVLNRIRLFRARSGLNASQFAKHVGLGDTTLRKMMDQDWNPTVAILRTIEKTIPPEFTDNANDDDVLKPDPAAALADRGDDQHKAA
ncbi:hypothetical protein [Paremcibacter congregatus]|uniref:hypothetical protein n=1 Tax=Paremcibacter congregatus TaxID=2043170 RepID=UPI003A908513